MMEAVFGLLGVIVGSFIPWIKDSLHQGRLRTENATYLAVRVICILDEYIDKCVEVIHDDGTVMGQAAHRDENGFEHYIPQVPLPPAPVFPDNVDWKCLDTELMYRILAFPNEVRSTKNSVDFVGREVASPPDYDELFEARYDGYADLGLEAIELVELLRARYGLKPKQVENKFNPDWNPKEYLKKKKRELDERRERRASSMAELMKVNSDKEA